MGLLRPVQPGRHQRSASAHVLANPEERARLELSKHEPDYLRVSRTREELLHLVYLDLMKVTGPRDAECGVCLWTRLAHEYAQRGQPAEEVRSYNRASAFRTFYNSKLYRSAVEKQIGAAA